MKKENKPDTARGALVAAELEKLYPDAECSLDWGGKEPWRLMVMGRLSAQCTDARVNIVCKDLFERFPTLTDLADVKNADCIIAEGCLTRCPRKASRQCPRW